jgi:hypothetical protein
MLKLLKQLTWRPKTIQLGVDRSNLAPVNLQRTGLENELVRLALKQVMKKQGIPSNWLATDGVRLHTKGGVERRCIHLQIKQWNEKLLHYAPALQKKILSTMDLFDPKIDHSAYMFAWSFAENIDYPISELPNIVIWSNPDVHSPERAPYGISNVGTRLTKADLDELFAEQNERNQAFADTDVTVNTRPMEYASR